MPQIELFRGPLTSSFQPSVPFTIVSGLAVLDFTIDVSLANTAIEWYFELGSNLTQWFREMGEESPSTGTVVLTPLVRRFQSLAVGSYAFDVQSAKAHDLCRIQIRLATGIASAVVTTPIALPAQEP